ncbi:hypothetical protein AB0D94_19435 [Streptomyces sp. NPDC048255]
MLSDQQSVYQVGSTTDRRVLAVDCSDPVGVLAVRIIEYLDVGP